MRIGIDLLGCDTSPNILFEGVLKAAQETQATLVVFLTESILSNINSTHSFPLNIEIVLVEDYILMEEEPLQAISQRMYSSMVVGIDQLKQKKINAFISVGNTGALLASATINLPHLANIKRPALIILAPTLKGNVALLDVGGNVSCKTENLVQFAYMGAAFYKSCHPKRNPKVGLLNIGTEPSKGTTMLKEAYALLKEEKDLFEFSGNVEGRDVFQGVVDVLVTDGFTGNVFLKTCEGISDIIFRSIQNNPEIDPIKKKFSQCEYPGAILCGLEEIVMKCHGNSSAQAIYRSIQGATKLVEHEFISVMKKNLKKL